MSWKASLPCTRAEAVALSGDIAALAALDDPPVLMTSEADAKRPDAWRLDAYFEAKPGKADLALLAALVPSAKGAAPAVEKLQDEDWVTLSQAGLEPIRAGRFFVHTPAYRDTAPQNAIALEVDAGLAFGTGQHETTAGCLEALDRLKRQGCRFANIADVGTGTGLLAFAAQRLWRQARIIASDIDPVSIEVTAENAAINAVPRGRGPRRTELVVAVGMEHPRLAARVPYDLILANILAGPLIDLAPALAGALAPRGSLILAGLLNTQADAVLSAYRRQGMRLVARDVRGDWTILTLRKRLRYGWR